MSNYPNGVTSGDIDSLCQSDNSTPNRHDCIGCSREIEQCDDTRWWFFADEFTYTKPTHRCDFTDAFETFAGWVCSTACWNDHALDENDDDPPCMSRGCSEGDHDGCTDVAGNCCDCTCHLSLSTPKLFLVGGAR